MVPSLNGEFRTSEPSMRLLDTMVYLLSLSALCTVTIRYHQWTAASVVLSLWRKYCCFSEKCSSSLRALSNLYIVHSCCDEFHTHTRTTTWAGSDVENIRREAEVCGQSQRSHLQQQQHTTHPRHLNTCTATLFYSHATCCCIILLSLFCPHLKVTSPY